jgi:flavorubredoxin
VTQATAEAGNIQQTAEALGKELEAAGHSVVILTADECRDPRYITQARALVLGCPDYFGLPPWQMVRFIDETLYRLYRARVRLNEHVVTSFATTPRCQAVLRGILQSTRGKTVDGAVITPRGTTEADREAAIKELAKRISDGL